MHRLGEHFLAGTGFTAKYNGDVAFQDSLGDLDVVGHDRIAKLQFVERRVRALGALVRPLFRR